MRFCQLRDLRREPCPPCPLRLPCWPPPSVRGAWLAGKPLAYPVVLRRVVGTDGDTCIIVACLIPLSPALHFLCVATCEQRLSARRPTPAATTCYARPWPRRC